MAAVDTTQPYVLKILTVGDVGVGKTSILKRYVHGAFSMNYKSTIGVDFLQKSYCITNPELQGVFPGDKVNLQLWDIAGQERFGNMTRVYYKYAIGAIVVCDVTKKGTFEATTKWKQDLEVKVSFPTAPQEEGVQIPVVLLANKVDDATRTVMSAEIKQKATDEKYDGWQETSAKDGTGLNEAIDKLLAAIVAKVKKHPIPRDEPEPAGVVPLGKHSAEKKDEKCCS